MSTFSEKGLSRLREAVRSSGIKQITLAERLGVNKGTVNRWIRKGVRPQSERLEHELASALGVCWEWLFDDGYEGPARSSDDYSPTPEHLGQPEQGRGDITAPDAGSYGIPDIEHHGVTRTYGPDEKWYLDAVREVLRSGEHGTIIALQSNIVQFREQVRDRVERRKNQGLIRQINHENQRLNSQNRELNERVAELERRLRKANSARGPSEKNHDDIRSLRIRDDNLQNSGDG